MSSDEEREDQENADRWLREEAPKDQAAITAPYAGRVDGGGRRDIGKLVRKILHLPKPKRRMT